MLELLHSLVYYAPERPEVYTELGFKGGWMGYFATRSAALGQVPPAVVTACFYGFAPRMVERALPDAWSHATPEEAVAARYRVFHRASTRMLGHDVDHWADTKAVRGLVGTVTKINPAGCPLFAAHASLSLPDEPHLRLFWAAAALRELRGDAHIVALQHAEVGPVQSHVLMVALGLVPADQRNYRGWTEEEWADGVDSLVERGWLQPTGEVTPEGRRARSMIERDTDRLSSREWTKNADGWAADVTNALAPVVGHIITGGAVPFPNGMGVASVSDRAPTL